MSKGLDQQLILDYYQRMTDSEVARIATNHWTSLTPEAQEVLKNESARRKIDIDWAAIAEIAHIKLLGESRMATNDERLTDLTTIFFGLASFSQVLTTLRQRLHPETRFLGIRP